MPLFKKIERVLLQGFNFTNEVPSADIANTCLVSEKVKPFYVNLSPLVAWEDTSKEATQGSHNVGFYPCM